MDSKVEQARVWAESVGEIEGLHPELRAAVEVIQSLPDQWIDAEKVREFIEEWRTDCPAGDGPQILDQLESLLPAPPLPTFADMTPEEREACRWMQAQTWYEVGIIVWVDEMTEIAQLITRANGVLERKFKDVTPLPDLPKLEWPGSTPDDVAYATGGVLTTQDVVDECRAVRKERALPRPGDVPAGEPWIVRYERKEWVGVRANGDKAPWHIISMDGLDCRDVEDSEIALMPRLVPERKENA